MKVYRDVFRSSDAGGLGVDGEIVSDVTTAHGNMDDRSWYFFPRIKSVAQCLGRENPADVDLFRQTDL